MAKRDGRDDITSVDESAALEETAAAVDNALGESFSAAEAKWKAFIGQRDSVLQTIRDIRDRANQLLREAGEGVTGGTVSSSRKRGRPAGARTRKVAARRGPGRPPGSKNKTKKPGRKRGSTMSEATRRKMSEAAKARWAAKKQS